MNPDTTLHESGQTGSFEVFFLLHNSDIDVSFAQSGKFRNNETKIQ